MAQGFLSLRLYLLVQEIGFRVEIEWIQCQFVIRNIEAVAFVDN